MMPKPNCQFSLVLTLLLLALFAWPVRAQAPIKVSPYRREPSAKALKWANDELRKMSLEEKIGQLISVGVNATFLNQDSEPYRTLKHHIEDNKVGGIILFRGSVYESVILVNRMQQLARYPLLISADLEAVAESADRLASGGYLLRRRRQEEVERGEHVGVSPRRSGRITNPSNEGGWGARRSPSIEPAGSLGSAAGRERRSAIFIPERGCPWCLASRRG